MQALLAILLAVAMATLDTAVVNTALPTIAKDIGTSDASAIWVVNAYQLAVVSMILPSAALGDIVGHRWTYVTGLVLFTVTSLACGFAWSLPSLVAARVLQGLGAAMIMSVNVALIRIVYPAKELGRGVGFNALVVALAFTAGPTIASGILFVSSWHWLFLVNVPAGLVSIWLCLKTLPPARPASHDFDPVGAMLCAGFFAFLTLGIGTTAQLGAPLLIASEWAASAACGITLLRRQVGHPAPILAVDLFRLPLFALSAITAVCSFATQGLAFVSLPFLLQGDLGHSQVETGFLMTPWPAVVAIMAPIAGRLSDRYPPAILGGLGLMVLSCGMASLALMPPDPSALDISWRLVVCGMGFGFFQSPNLRAIMGAAPPTRSGGASGIIGTARLIGQTSGAALVALCFNLSHTKGPLVALWLGCGFAGVGCVMSLLRLVQKKPARA